jgi:hypothetical protein
MADEPPQQPVPMQEGQAPERILQNRDPQGDQPPDLVLQYRSPGLVVQRPPRKPLPAALCWGFFGACIVIGAAWMSIAQAWHRTPWMVVPMLIVIAAAGGAGLLFARSRVASIGVLLALGVWLLIWGPCASLGGV